MPLTIRQQLVDAVLVRLRTIDPLTVVNGSAGYYLTDIGHYVYEWRDLSTMPFDADNASDLEAISINDFEESGDQEITNRHDKEVSFEIEFATNKNTDSISLIERLRTIDADIEKCIGVDRKWSGIARDTRVPEKTEFAVKQSGRNVAVGRKVFKIRIRHKSFDPYTA